MISEARFFRIVGALLALTVGWPLLVVCVLALAGLAGVITLFGLAIMAIALPLAVIERQ